MADYGTTGVRRRISCKTGDSNGDRDLDRCVGGSDDDDDTDALRDDLRRFRSRRCSLAKFWTVHSVVCLCVVLAGVYDNVSQAKRTTTVENDGSLGGGGRGGRKYIPVDAEKLRGILGGATEVAGGRAYVNVHSSSPDEDGAVVLCYESGGGDRPPRSTYEEGLCHPGIVGGLPFAGRLARMPDAWILPLLPILLRLAYQLVAAVGGFGSGARIIASSKRLLFYLFLLNFRGWVLYVAANALEDQIVLQWFAGDDDRPCWYIEALRPRHRSEGRCHGRPFDFADHVVLFLAGYLPVFLMEICFCHLYPFWKVGGGGTVAAPSPPPRKLLDILFPTLHALLFVYLNLIVLHATCRTAAYFHTPSEVAMGYVLSSTLQLFVAYVLLCDDDGGEAGGGGRWRRWMSSTRWFVGLPSFLCVEC